MSNHMFTRHDIVTWMIEEAAADCNGLTIDKVHDKTYRIIDQELQTGRTVTVADVSATLDRWATAVINNANDFCNYWVVAAQAVHRADWDGLDYDATISTRVVQLACNTAIDVTQF